MQDSLFAFDYGTGEYAPKKITNPTELIRGKDLYHMLRLCGVEAEKRLDEWSDWELFSSFARELPSLRGFPLAEFMQSLLRDVAGVPFPLNAENAAAFWRESVSYFERECITPGDALTRDIPRLCRADAPCEVLDRSEKMLPDAMSLLPIGCTTLDAWQKEIGTVLSRFSGMGSRVIFMELPCKPSFAEPNPYRVGEILRKTHRRDEDRACLVSQLLREVCVGARSLGMTVLLKVCRYDDALPFLSYIEKTVGLPSICLCSDDPILSKEGQELFARQSERLMVALSLHAFPTEHELNEALLSIAARYPFGRLFFVTGVDLRFARYAQAEAYKRICRIVEKSFEKN